MYLERFLGLKRVNTMNSYCLGCGTKKQTDNKNNLGYVRNLENLYCDRCYQLKHRNEKFKQISDENYFYDVVEKTISPYETVILVVDVTNINASINDQLRSLLKNKKIFLIANKVDIIPQVIRPIKVLNWLEKILDLNFIDILLVSTFKKLNIDEIINSLHEEEISEIPIIGMANVGKSSLVNALIKSKTPDEDLNIISSPYAGTTLDEIKVDVDGITFIDTPGIVNNYNIQNVLGKESLKLVIPKKEYRQRTYQLQPGNSLLISSLVELDFIKGADVSCSVFVSDNINIHRFKTHNREEIRNKHLFNEFLSIPNQEEKELFTQFRNINLPIPQNKMLLIDGLGWVTFNNKKEIEFKLTIPSNVGYKLVDSLFKEEIC